MKKQDKLPLHTLFEELLKKPLNLTETLHHHEHPRLIIGKLLLINLLAFSLIGLVIGSFSCQEQLWAALVKTLINISFSSLICLPSLYIFSALSGSTLGIKEIAQAMTAALTLMASLLIALTPVLWVFSHSTNSPVFFGSLLLLVWLIALFFGSSFLLRLLKKSGSNKTIYLKTWSVIFLLVTLQISTVLRPLIGRSEHFFTSEKRFFLEHWSLIMKAPAPLETSPPQEDARKCPKDKEQVRGASLMNPYLMQHGK